MIVISINNENTDPSNGKGYTTIYFKTVPLIGTCEDMSLLF